MKKLILSITSIILGVGVSNAQAAAPSVALTWKASTSATTTNPGTANVYRLIGTCPASVTTTGGFSLIANNQPDGGPYSDTTVALGTTYCYVVTAVIGGVESNPSGTFQATIAPQPAPPTGLTGTVTN